MRSLLFLLVLLPLLGCAKKPKITGKSDDTPAPHVAEKPKDKDKAASTEKPNWVIDKKKEPRDELPAESGPGVAGKPPPWIPPSGVVPVGNPMANPQQPGLPANPGMPPLPMGQPAKPPQVNPAPPANPGVGQTPARPGKAVTKDDIDEVWIFIENRSLATGKMPNRETVFAALIDTKAASALLVQDGSIILTGATQREGIWAYEKNAASNGGWIATQNGSEQVTAAEFARRVGR